MSTGQLIAHRFRIADLKRDLLGRGGMGDVYRATDLQTGETVAVKALNPDVLARDPGLLERFLREGEALRRLNHPNIVHMVASCEERGRHYLIMEYVGGGSLETLLQKEGRLSPTRTIEIALDLADALTRAHRLGIIHRDLKPANVLLAPDGTPRLADFGIAHVATGPQLTQTGMLIGTVDYLSPEACQGEPLDERADIWAFGVLLFEMLSGQLPFGGDNLPARLTAILLQPTPDLAALATGLPDGLVDLVYRMLEKDREQRIPSVRLVGAELDALHKGRMPVRAPSPAVTSAPLGAPTPSAAPRPSASQTDQASRPAFVAREHELSALESFLQAALAGQGRVTFVVGEAGQGKTALLQEFARRAQAACPDLVVASGDCDAYTGIGDPYLPLREILALLTGDVESRLLARAMGTDQARRLRDLLPVAVRGFLEGSADLVDVFVPGAELLRRALSVEPWPDCDAWIGRLAALVERKATLPGDPNLQQAALFEQYTRLLTKLADERPLLLLIDDLQWADGGSCSLLFHLGKRIAGSRIMILGAYRPSEVALGRAGERHPLETVFNELRRLYGDNQLDLGLAEGRAFVDAFLDSEPNQLNEEFRQSLYAVSQGQPLATVELLRDLQARGGLVQDSTGCWTARPGLEWSAFPARVEAMIAERIARLDEQQRHALQVASVEGETFTAEVVARVVGVGERDVVRLLSEELDRAHRLVRAEGVRHLDGQRLSIYRFRHILFQKYLYTTLDAVESSHLHDAVASALQALHGEQTDDVAAELARHFGAAGATDEAADFLKRAGDRAAALVAPGEAAQYYLAARDAYTKAYGEGWNPMEQAALERKIGEALFRHGDYREAAEHLQRALGLLGAGVPDSRGRVQRALLAQMLRQVAHRLLPRYFRHAPAGAVPAAVELKLELWYSLSLIDFISSRQERHLLLVFKILNEAESQGSVPWIARSCAGLTFPLDAMALGRLARAYSLRAVDLAEQVQDREVLELAHQAAAHHAMWIGQWDAALQHGEASLAALGADSASFQRVIAAWVVASALICQGKAHQALAVGEDLVRTGDQRADLEMGLMGAGRVGLALSRLGRLRDARPALERAIELADTIPDDMNRVQARGDLGQCLLRLGQRETALEVLEEACRLARKHQVLPHNSAPAWAGLVEAYLQCAEQTPGADRTSWLEKAFRTSEASLKNARHSPPAGPEAMRLRGIHEWLRGNRKSAQKWWQRSAALAAQLGMQYDLAISLLETGRRLHKRADLEQAEAILSEIDAKWDLARAKEALKELGASERQEPTTS